jgi:hypothetical protein
MWQEQPLADLPFSEKWFFQPSEGLRIHLLLPPGELAGVVECGKLEASEKSELVV